MANVHVHLHVKDLDASRRFYEGFFGGAPVKVKPDYLKFLPALAPINLALSTGESGRGKTIDHLGFQVESPEVVRVLLDRAKAAGLAVREEMGVDCCYSNQDKFWVQDPDGVEWEVYHLNFDAGDEDEPHAAASSCCTPLARIGRRP